MLELFGHTEFELFKRAFKEKGFDSLKKDPKRTHSADRAYERAISEAEIRSVFKNGDIVEYYQGNGIKKMLLWGFHYLGRKKYRPIHVVLKKEMTESCGRLQQSMILVLSRGCGIKKYIRKGYVSAKKDFCSYKLWLQKSSDTAYNIVIRKNRKGNVLWL
ncbi:DUF4258 domain-containing protein [Desulfitobacterium hafniense]|uniref:DUF4258 domain-containing protein n=1 Tax=Desulfitobacterium hafniense TaxID=49338 RepID=UPI0012F95FA4|nr:DUF4258 domain-containing protein [Desulfitobacterium hafniense]